ncbi:MAG: hypothetical protein H7210_13770 [Pyrinomonadaceae bacterium]|nr:hypothetical protein [Phycisphaerales bacterium]
MHCLFGPLGRFLAHPVLHLALVIVMACPHARAGVTFRVSIDKSVHAGEASGRLVVYLIGQGSAVGPDPADGPFFEDPQPMFGVDVRGITPGVPMIVDDTATGFPAPLSELTPGTYKVQAVLDMHRDNSSWRHEPGNLYSGVTTIKFIQGDPDRVIDLTLSKATIVEDEKKRSRDRGETIEITSKLLSDFRGRQVKLRAGVVAPRDRDPARAYPAIYEVPGFGGDHTSAFRMGGSFQRAAVNSSIGQLYSNSFWIVLDPESPNGHHLFANSANNGPVADALIKELIPAIEKKYNLIPQPSARLLRGHSSGGWSTLWLATQYPETFGATWSTSPDSVDFRKFQLIDLYKGGNAYYQSAKAKNGAGVATVSADQPIPSYRLGEKEVMTILDENRMEEVLGPGNTSGQQWDSWFAVFGPRGKDGNPAAAWDAKTGRIDHTIAEQYRAYDIAALLRQQPEKYGPIFKQRVRIVIGDADNYYLNEAVSMLKQDVDKLNFIDLPEGVHGSITIVPGRDHSSIFGTKEIQSIPAEMAEHLKRNGHWPK